MNKYNFSLKVAFKYERQHKRMCKRYDCVRVETFLVKRCAQFVYFSLISIDTSKGNFICNLFIYAINEFTIYLI